MFQTPWNTPWSTPLADHIHRAVLEGGTIIIQVCVGYLSFASGRDVGVGRLHQQYGSCPYAHTAV